MIAVLQIWWSREPSSQLAARLGWCKLTRQWGLPIGLTAAWQVEGPRGRMELTSIFDGEVLFVNEVMKSQPQAGQAPTALTRRTLSLHRWL